MFLSILIGIYLRIVVSKYTITTVKSLPPNLEAVLQQLLGSYFKQPKLASTTNNKVFDISNTY